MAYTLELSRRTIRATRRFAPAVQRRLTRAISALRSDPRPPGAIKLTGPDPPQYRIRVGDYRILYIVDDARQVVYVLRVRHRSQAYREL